ncbi:membrane protein [hydrothermal vent metagenome]|uniref:Membrane protein n=1 Tax=hydrothermal vent metagenome TaxID=652676 RepID=A0A3B1E1K5_9ZZZZ
MLGKIYKKFVIQRYKEIFFTLLLLIPIAGIYSSKMQIDASAETLLLEEDKDLAFSRQMSQRYKTQDFLVVTFSPNDGNLFSDSSINAIKELSYELESLSLVSGVTSIINVPLLQSPPLPIKELLKNIPTLLSKDINKTLAKQELLTSPMYKENLVSNDFGTTALLVNLEAVDTKEMNHKNIMDIRKIIQKYKKFGTINLGGVSMIADDLISFVKYDLRTFSIVVFLLLLIILFILFREIKWIVLPIFICSVSIIITTGLLGLLDWKVTVISSNFISLQLIMNISLVIHLIVKYKELLEINMGKTQEELILETIFSMIKPSFFVIITTIVGFVSLVFSGILPVANFGYMMGIGLILSFVLTFLIFPVVLLFFKKDTYCVSAKKQISITSWIAHIAYSYQKTIIVGAIFLMVFSLTGAKQLFVENSFIDYFKKDTQIYKGMKAIDEKLGGTTPLDVVVTFRENEKIRSEMTMNGSLAQDDEDLDSFVDEFAEDKNDETYWFTQYKMEKIRLIHNYLDSLPQIGKVLSLSTLDEVGKTLNNGKYLDSFELALLNKKLPEKYKSILLNPYVNIEHNQARISVRILDSQKNLRRDDLIKKIKTNLHTMLNKDNITFQLSNLLILYNNMLQSLFDSQIKTLGIVLIILFIMFLLLFRSIYIAFIALVANIIPIGTIFGFMGWLSIPLDMMTITIAAISIGIAVDDTIHYIHRFKTEFLKTNNYKESMFNTHRSIGKAMFYTSTVIIVGFSVLILSNFIPTIYFGLLVLLAMFMAMVADLFLLPVLLILLKPLKSK